MKILHVHPHLSVYGGAEILLVNLTREMISLGHDCCVLTLSLSEDVRKKFHPSVQFFLPAREGVYKLRSVNAVSALGFLCEFYHLQRLVSEFNRRSICDFVILHNFPSSWTGWGIDCRVIWMCNEPPMICNNDSPGLLLTLLVKMGSFIDRFVVRGTVDQIVVSDRFNKKRVRERYGVEAVVNHYGVDYEEFSCEKRGCAAGLDIPETSCLVLQVGVFSPQKNQMVTLRAFARLLEVKSDAVLLFVGDDENEYARAVFDEAVRMGVDGKVVFMGKLSQEQVGALYRMSDYSVFPVLAQGGWLSPFEAICAGARVVVSETFTAADIIKENRLGCVLADFENEFVDCVDNWQGYGLPDRFQRSLWVRENLTWRKFSANFFDVAESISRTA